MMKFAGRVPILKLDLWYNYCNHLLVKISPYYLTIIYHISYFQDLWKSFHHTTFPEFSRVGFLKGLVSFNSKQDFENTQKFNEPPYKKSSKNTQIFPIERACQSLWVLWEYPMQNHVEDR